MVSGCSCERENLRAMFISLTYSLQVTGDITAAQNTLYKEIISKLCNIRIKEFILAQKQRYATVKDCASTAGKNLHYKLLSLHTNLQTHHEIELCWMLTLPSSSGRATSGHHQLLLSLFLL